METEAVTAWTFYKFNPSELSSYPSFRDALSPDACTENLDIFLEDQEIPAPAWITTTLSPVKHICERFGFKVLLADLSIIQDLRWVPRGRSPYLVNYIACYYELEDGGVVGAYLDALEFMKGDFLCQEREPILPHPKLLEYFCFLTPIGEHETCPPTPSPPLKVSKHSACRQRYEYRPGKGHLPIPTLVYELLGEFLRCLNQRAQGASAIFQNALSLIIPFSREAFLGGGLFLLIKPNEPTKDWQTAAKHCADSLQYMLTRATLNEAVASRTLDLERAHGVELLQNLAWGFGHDLKNRLAESSFLDLLECLRDNAPVEPADLKACLEKLELLYGIVEILRVGDKLTAGVFPREWARRDLVDAWPEKFEASHLQQAAASCRTAVRQGVTPYFRPLLDQGRHCCLREVDSSQGVWEVPLDDQGPWELPPLSGLAARRGSPAPELAVLAGLAEIVRNAARAIADNATAIEVRYQKVHLDYQVEIGEDYVRVTVWNPYHGDSPPLSPSLGRLHDMYQALTAIEIDSEITVVDRYHHAYTPAAPGYAQATFTWWPKRLRFA